MFPIFDIEQVSNVLPLAIRQKRIQETNVFRFINLIQNLPIEPLNFSSLMANVFLLATKHQLSAYNATDLALKKGKGSNPLDTTL